MPETKQIKFEIVGDASQLNRAIEQAVRSVSGLMGQLNKASGGILGGGGGVGASVSGAGPIIPGANQPNAQNTNASITRAVEDNRKLLDTLKGASAETMRTMADVASRELDREKTAIKALNEQLEKLNQNYRILKNTTGDEKMLGDIAGQVRSANGELGNRKNNADALQQIVNGGNPPEPPGPPGGGGGLFGPNGPLGPLLKAVRPLALWNAVAGTVAAVPREFINQANDQVDSQVRQAAFKRMGLATRHGDLRYAYAAMNMSTDEMAEFNTTASTGLRQVEFAGKHLQPAEVLKLFANPAGSIFGGAREFMHLSDAAKEEAAAYLDKLIASDPLKYDSVNQFSGLAGSRVQMMRALGTGSEGLDAFTKPLEQRGYSQGEVVGTFSGIASAVGRDAAKTLTGLVLNGMSAGMNSGMLNSLATAGAMSGNSGLINIIGTSKIGLGAQNSIGAFLASQAVNQLGAGDVTGLAGMLMNGMGSDGAANALDAQQRIAGVGLMGRIAGGIDPYSQGMNLLSAYRHTAGTNSIYAARGLMQLTGREFSSIAAGGAIPAFLQSAGVTSRSSVMGFLNDAITTAASDYLVFDPKDHSGLANANRALRGSGDIKSKVLRYLGKSTGAARKKRVSDLAGNFQFAGFGDVNDTTGLVEDIAGLGHSGAANGKLPDGAGGSNELELMKQLAIQAGLVTTEFKGLATTVQGLNAIIGKFNRSGDTDVSPENVGGVINSGKAAAAARQNAAKTAAAQAVVEKRLRGGGRH